MWRVGQRHGHAVEHAAILALELQRHSARFRLRYGFAQRRHVTASSSKGLHQARRSRYAVLAQRSGDVHILGTPD